MKKDEIEDVVNAHFKKIEKYFQKIIKDFKEDDIHNFRTEIKKLRSFMHLLEMEEEEGIHFNTAKKLKAVYGYIGVIRNLQLQIKSIQKFAKSSGKMPAAYLGKLEKEIEDWQKKIREYMGDENNFYDEEKLVKARLPEKLKKKSARQFIQFTLYKLEALLNRLYDDDAIHGIRKLMKDIFYNRSFLENYTTSLPAGLSDEKEIKECIEMLGFFHDRCAALALLQTYNDASLVPGEKEMLQQIEQKWETEKEGLKQKIDARLIVLELTPSKIKSITFADTAFH